MDQRPNHELHFDSASDTLQGISEQDVRIFSVNRDNDGHINIYVVDETDVPLSV